MSKVTGRILVVDDQENWREALVSLLHQEGHVVETCATYEETIIKVEESEFDLLIVDVRLVDSDLYNIQGVELVRFVKEQLGVAKTILLTGYPDSIRESALNHRWVDALVLKVSPDSGRFDSRAFKDLVENLLLDRHSN